MKSSQLNRVLSLVKKTGDRVVVLAADSDEVVVLMRLDEYENLVSESPWIGELPDASRNALTDDWDTPELPPAFAKEIEPLPVASEAADDEWQLGTPLPKTSYSPLAMEAPDPSPVNDSTPIELGLSDILHEESDPPFYLEPVE